MSDKPVKLFVYGTLMKGGLLHSVIENCGGKFIGAHLTLPIYDLVEFAGFPAIYMSKSGGTQFHVAGEVWEVPEYAIYYIDKIEAGYERIKALLTKSTKLEYNESAYMYKFTHNPAEFITYPPNHILTISIPNVTHHPIRIWINDQETTNSSSDVIN